MNNHQHHQDQFEKTMKKKTQNNEHEHEHEHDIEILKAAAQAWHGHSTSSSSSTSEYDVHRLFFKIKPTRFKLEAIQMANKNEKLNRKWDFAQSLWDSYEIISVSKKLERGLMMESPFSALGEEGSFVSKKNKKIKEKTNSLRYLFRMSSTRFSEVDLPADRE